jgi:prepilin-type N-terminal cleavage/methylation domain-containing protein/prepilin-type processing-associated H-X9-DG protein
MTTPPSRGGRGFTLIELVVVLAIIGVLLSLLLVGIQRAREAASRGSCLNNLRQVGLALHHYHDNFGAFPPGVSAPGPDNPYPWMSWHTRILPYTDNTALWEAAVRAYQIDSSLILNPPHTDLSTVVRVYTCPSDPRTAAAHPVPSYPSCVVAYTDYLGNEGINAQRLDGVLYVDSRIRLADITDGTSTTLLAGERPPRPDGFLGWWYGGWGYDFATATAEDVLGVAEKCFDSAFAPQCPVGPYQYGPGRLDNPCDAFHFWSLHIGGANFLFADGSVRFLPYSASKVMRALATRAGGEVVADFD